MDEAIKSPFSSHSLLATLPQSPPLSELLVVMRHGSPEKWQSLTPGDLVVLLIEMGRLRGGSNFVG